MTDVVVRTGKGSSVRRSPYVKGAARALQMRGISEAKMRSLRAREMAIARSRGMNRATRGLQLGPTELKAVDVSGQINADLTGGVALLNGLGPGSDINQRIGRQIMMKSVMVTFQLNVTAGTGVDQVHRVLIVYDRQANAAAPTTANIISAAGSGYDVIRPKNLENRSRFKILFDRTYYLNASGESLSGRVEKFYRRLAHPTTFNAGVAGTIADITTGSLYIVCVGNIAVGATAGQLTYFSRVRYDDR